MSITFNLTTGELIESRATPYEPQAPAVGPADFLVTPPPALQPVEPLGLKARTTTLPPDVAMLDVESFLVTQN